MKSTFDRPDPKCNGVGIKAVVLEGELLSIPLHPGNAFPVSYNTAINV